MESICVSDIYFLVYFVVVFVVSSHGDTSLRKSIAQVHERLVYSICVTCVVGKCFAKDTAYSLQMLGVEVGAGIFPPIGP